MQLYDTMSNENPIEREKFSIKMEEMLWKHTLRERPKMQGAPKKKNVVNLDSVTDRQQTHHFFFFF